MKSQQQLEQPTLVLNKNWLPIQTTTTRNAIGMVAAGAAHIVDPDDYVVHDLLSWNDLAAARDRTDGDVIRSRHLAIPCPEIIVLTNYAGVGDRRVVFSRANLFRRDRYSCQYCGKRPRMEDLTIDHVLPRCQGGRSSWENCVLACYRCNSRKGGRTPKQAGMTLRSVPRPPSRDAFLRLSPRVRKESWDKFVDRAYWEVELEND